MAHIFGSVWDRFNRNALNDLSKSVEQQGKSFQDLVAKGQLTPAQYSELIKNINDMAEKSEVRLNTDDFPINVSEMDTETKALFTGGAVAVVGENAVGKENVKNKAISPEKTDFFHISSNLFNKNNIKLGTSIDNDGNEEINPLYWLSLDFIPVNTGDVISFSGSSAYRVARYDENKEWLFRGGPDTDGKFTNNSSVARFIKVSGIEDVDSVMINRGETLLPYDEYGAKIKDENLPKVNEFSLEDGSVTPNKTSFFKTSKNLFDKETIKSGVSYDRDGNEEVAPLYWLSLDFIPVGVGEEIYFNSSHPFRVSQYRDNKEFYSRGGTLGFSEGIQRYVNTTSVTSFIRISGLSLVDVNKLMVTRDEPLDFEPFGSEVIDEKHIPIKQRTDIDVEEIKEEIYNHVLSNVDVKNPYPPQFQLQEVHRGSRIPLWLSEDGTIIFGRTGSTKLTMSLDEWETVVEIATLPRHIQMVRELGDGELIVSCSRDADNDIKGKVYKSRGFDRGNPENTVFEEVFEISGVLADINNSWGISFYENIVVISEYGLQGTTGARYVYYSDDFGESFRMIFDLQTEEIEGRPPVDENAHTHTVAYDPFYNRIWLLVGDGDNTAVYYTDNIGEKWVLVENTSVVQFTGIIALEDSVVIGSDRSPNGLYVYRRTNDKSKKPKVEPYYIVNNHTRTSHVFQLPYRRTIGKDVPTYFTATAATGALDSTLVMGFVDGRKAHVLYETEEIYSRLGSAGAFTALGDTAHGSVVIHIQETSGEHVVYKAPAPVWE